jgi:hypothetical protein
LSSFAESGSLLLTTKASTLYAFMQGWHESTALIPSLGTGSPQNPARIITGATLREPIK